MTAREPHGKGGIARLVGRFEGGRRFWRHVRVGGREECWLWEGKVDADGHGVYGGERADARAYALVLGGEPPAAVEHRCDEPRCVNPEHLRPARPAS